MKNLLLVLFSILVFSPFSKAQIWCTPDSAYVDSSFGIYPKILPPLVAGQPYHQTVTIKTFVDSNFYFQGIPVMLTAKAVKIYEVLGLPDGFEVDPQYNDPLYGYWVNWPLPPDTISWHPMIGCIEISADAAAVDAALATNPNGGNFQIDYILDIWCKGNPIPATYTWLSTLGTPPYGAAFNVQQYIGGIDSCGYHFTIITDSTDYDTYYAGLPSTAGSYDVQISSVAGCDWSLSSNCNWVTASASAGVNMDIITFNYSANTTGAPRYCNFYIGGRIYKFTQISEECNVVLEVPDTIVGPLELTGYLYVDAADSCYWSIINRTYCDWIDVSPTAGQGSATLILHVNPNNTNESRYCDITINGTTLHFKQESPLSVSENKTVTLTLYPNPAADLVNITLPATTGKNTLSIYNTAGQLISQQNLTAQTNQISTTGLANGIYIFVVQNADIVVGRQRVAISH